MKIDFAGVNEGGVKTSGGEKGYQYHFSNREHPQYTPTPLRPKRGSSCILINESMVVFRDQQG